jgi:hypothetical protein
MKQGVPFRVAFDMTEPLYLDEEERFAMAVVLGEFEGGKFSWEACRWLEKN